MPRYVTSAPYGIRGNIPNSTYWHTTPDTRAHMRINSAGIRSDKEYSYTKKPRQCRIVIFGDSFFMGYEVSLEDSFAYLLENELNIRGYPCEVINLAVSGFGTAEMLVALQEEGKKYQPDLVIFQWHESDLDENIRSNLYSLNKDTLVRKNNKYLPGIKTRDWLMQFSVYRFIIENSQLYSALRESAATKIKRFLAKNTSNSQSRTPPHSDNIVDATHSTKPLVPYNIKLAVKLLLSAKNYSSSINAKFMVVDVPVKWKNQEMYSSLSKLPKDIGSDLSIVTPINKFKQLESNNNLLYYENGAGHWNVLGNKIVADQVTSTLINSDWLNSFYAMPQ